MRLGLISSVSLIIFACASAQKAPVANFGDLIRRANELRETGNTEKTAYQSLVGELARLTKENPRILDDAGNKKLAADFIAAYPAVSCPVEISEPPDKLFTVTGYASPLVLTTACPVSAPFAFEADSADIALAPEGFAFSKGKMTAKIRVSSASTEKNKNRLRFAARYYAADFLAALTAGIASDAKADITLSPAEYTLNKQPTASVDSYGNMRRNFRKAVLTSTVSSGDFGGEVAISESGQFTIGGFHSGRKFDLTYGHPNSVLPDGIGTSFTTVRIDGTDYRLEEQHSRLSKTDDGALVCEAKIAKTGITIVQILKPENASDRIKTRISYQIRNGSSKTHKVGIRLLMDTWAGHNDGVPFLLPTGESKQLYRSEVEFTPAASVMWQIYDLERAASPVNQQEPGLQNILVGKDLVPPDRIALANWPEAVGSVWDYAVSTDRRITGDSAVILWWHPADIKAESTQTVATELGAFLERREPAVFVTNADTGDLLVYLWHYNDSAAEQKVSYTVRSEKGNFSYPVEKDETQLAPHQVFIKATSAQILAEGGATIIVTENIDGLAKEYRFPIENLKQWKKFSGAPVAEPSKSFPVSYFDERDLKLTARLKNSAGKVLMTIDLQKAAIEGGFQYSGNFEIPAEAIAGRYTVEVVR